MFQEKPPIASPAEAMKLARENDVEMVDLRFIDLPGTWQHTSIPIHRLEESTFEDGIAFDGSSIRGFKAINESDMLLIPDHTSAKIDPYASHKQLVLICDIHDPITRQPYSRDPRGIARKVEAYLKSTGIADTAYLGPEAEFFVFDEVRYSSAPNHSFYFVDSDEAAWNTGREEMPNLGYKVRYKGGYFPVPPVDTLVDLRAEMCRDIMGLGYEVEVSHHEVATAGQSEIGMRFNTPMAGGDQMMWFKHVVKNVARRNGKTATFMPKPMYGDNGSGMHCHVSLWKNGRNQFFGNEYAGLSEMALHFIGGVIKHAKAVCALTNPTVNSYRRLVPGFEAPVNLAYSARNRSAAIRIPFVGSGEKAKRIEVRFPDPSCNPYLAFSALLMAGLDGIQKGIHPGDPATKDLYSLSPEELSNVPSAPGSLDEALAALEADHDFLLQGDVFSKDLLEEWVSYKRENETNPVKFRPTPLEYEMYFDV